MPFQRSSARDELISCRDRAAAVARRRRHRRAPPLRAATLRAALHAGRGRGACALAGAAVQAACCGCDGAAAARRERRAVRGRHRQWTRDSWTREACLCSGNRRDALSWRRRRGAAGRAGQTSVGRGRQEAFCGEGGLRFTSDVYHRNAAKNQKSGARRQPPSSPAVRVARRRTTTALSKTCAGKSQTQGQKRSDEDASSKRSRCPATQRKGVHAAALW